MTEPRDKRIRELEQTVRRLEEERELLVRRRRRNLLVIGISVSIMAHVGFFLYLNYIKRAAPTAGGAAAIEIELAVLHEQELTELEDPVEDVPPEPWEWEDFAPDEPAATFEADTSMATLNVTETGSVPTLGSPGAGDGQGSSLAGGAGTSFFGLQGRGQRFCWIVDVSGSMGGGNIQRKIDTCMKELAQSVERLPDFAQIFVVLYSTSPRPFHDKWVKARPHTISTLIRWLNDIDPGGGTRPVPAFEYVYALRDRPDVIFFLTDGLIPPHTPTRVAELNQQGKRVVINTIAFGDPTSQETLKRLASESGGSYRFVPAH